MDDSGEGLQFHIFTCEVESVALAVDPFVANFAAGPRLADADWHGPAFGTKQPFLDNFGFAVCAVNQYRRCREVPGYDDMGVAFRLHCQFAHCVSFPLSVLISARTWSSRS